MVSSYLTSRDVRPFLCVAAFPRVHQLVLVISFRRVPRERVQTCVDAHFAALRGCRIESLQLSLDLTSFNERKVSILVAMHHW